MTFDDQLQVGQSGELRIARWFRNRGFFVLPVYELTPGAKKGPRLLSPACELIAPDMFVFKQDKTYWIECKQKTHFSWHGKSQRWVTGIDLRLYEHYLRINDSTPWPVWVLFLHTESTPWTQDIEKWHCPDACPVGLFGNALAALRDEESHRDAGMVYWPHESFLPLANLGDL